MSHVLVTGANGFIGKNLLHRLSCIAGITISTFNRDDDPTDLAPKIEAADTIVHLAAENRPSDNNKFYEVNHLLSRSICHLIRNKAIAHPGRHTPIIFTSSIHVNQDTPYGISKLAAESEFQQLAHETSNPCTIYRLPGVFGKWSKPNYNSVVATFCYNLTRKIDINISEPSKSIPLIYIDDLIESIVSAISFPVHGVTYPHVSPLYNITLQELANTIKAFDTSIATHSLPAVGSGLLRALYATYLSFLPSHSFKYSLPQHNDDRGTFVEFLKTTDSGQLSYFTAFPGVTRGGHYHHTKNEKFLVVSGTAKFRFRCLVSNQYMEHTISASDSSVVASIPGWSHDITNIGTDNLIVLLWSSEVFDKTKPDTYPSHTI